MGSGVTPADCQRYGERCGKAWIWEGWLKAKAIDGGAALPDLYIVHIAIGAQGVTERYMWYPDRAPVLVPGKLGTVNISLHSFTEHILSLVREYMEKIGKDARYVLHWRGGEEEGDGLFHAVCVFLC